MITLLGSHHLLATLFALMPAAGGGRTGVASVPPSDPRIVGVWTLQDGDYPLTNEYRADGTLVQHVFGKTTDPVPFRIDGPHLVYTVKQLDGRVTEQKAEFTLAGDTRVLVDSPTTKRVFRRDKR
jgi:hypothetical protein